MIASDSKPFDDEERQLIEEIAHLLKESRRILMITGSGVSTESGIPTYRGATGLYNGRDVESGMQIEEILSGSTFAENPRLTWKYLLQIGRVAYNAKPNRTHQVIAEMEEHFPAVWVLTQNVDGLHQQAGSHQVIEIHGHYRTFTCIECGHKASVEEYAWMLSADQDELSIPRCQACGGIMRPDVVLFDEMLPNDAIQQMMTEARKGFDLIFSLGTTSVFAYISEPIALAQQMGIPTVEINPEATDISDMVSYRLRRKASEAMNRIWNLYHELE